MLLVLLVIFLAALPLAQKGTDTNLPAHTAPGDAPPRSDTIMIEYGRQGLSPLGRQEDA